MARKKAAISAPTSIALATEDMVPPAAQGIPAAQRLSDSFRAAMRQAIADHAGCEVLFVCSLDEDGRVEEVADIAHGTRGMVPAPRKQLLPGQVIIHNHPGGRLVPSTADVQMAAQLAEEGIGCWICDNQADRLYIITEAFRAETPTLISLDDLTAILEPGGELSRRFPDYSPRDSQIAMLRLVARAFNEDSLLAVEAGTGVGKTFAYLLPAVAWALANKERVVVSTATINLQQQIMDKDLPLVSKLLGGTAIKAVLAKGRGNYLCLKRLQESLDEDSLLREDDSELSRIAEWAKVTKEGSRSDLDFLPDDLVWSRINADADSCSGLSCGLRDRCFFFRARREASSANIIVANHHLLFADAAMRANGLGFENNVVLPAFTRLIFDEAHNIENNATNYFSQTLNKWMVLKLLNLLLRRRGGRIFGILPLILAGPSMTDHPTFSLKQLETKLQEIRDAMRVVDEETLALLAETGSLRLLPELKAIVVPLMAALKTLQTALLSVVEILGDLEQAVDVGQTAGEVPGLSDLQTLNRRLSGVAATCETLRNFEAEQDRVIWAERQRNPSGEGFSHLIACPLDIAPLLREAIFKPYPTVVMTSATLTIGGKFDYWSRRLGLGGRSAQEETERGRIFERQDEWDGYDSGAGDPDIMAAPSSDLDDADEVHLPFIDRIMLRKQLPSPFDYAHRVLLAVPRDAPEATGPDYQDYLQRFIARALEISQGHALVLFTSYDMLVKTWDAVKPRLDELGIPGLRQGSTERGKLLKQFNSESASVLFATESFWEGVDSPGDTLQVVILCRLPFKVPTEPLQLARSEAITARGGNPFMELSVPEAIMKFRQGFGRLMRRHDDFGVVLVPDKRIVTKAYGSLFLSSLPPTGRILGTSRQVMDGLADFLGRQRSGGS